MISNKLDCFEGKTVLITGGTGSFGRRFVKDTLQHSKIKKLVVFSRDEMKQWEMAQAYQADDRIRFFIGDVRDQSRLSRAFDGVDFVIHAAATKIVPTAEYNPFECIKTNILGAMNVIECAIDRQVSKVVALSTDKACAPVNLYGATKLASDKLFVAGNHYSGGKETSFSVVRYGNVMGSRGSVIPFFESIKHTNVLPITHKDMTRFMIDLRDAVDLVWHAFDDCVGGEIYISKLPSMKVVDIARAIAPDARLEYVGLRPGEKMHEVMIGIEDSEYTYDYGKYYKVLPNLYDWSKDPNRIKAGKKVESNFVYNSANNKDWMTVTDLQRWIAENREVIGKV